MKKTLLAVLLVLLCVACRQRRPGPVVHTDDTDTVELRLISASYYGGDRIAGAREVDYLFTSGNLVFDSEGRPRGTGYYVVVASLAEEVDKNYYPSTGIYRVSGTQAPMKLLPGSSAGSRLSGCYACRVEDGLESERIFFASGTMTMAGSAASTIFRMNFADLNLGEYNFVCTTPVVVKNESKPDATGPYSAEPEDPTLFTMNAVSATLKPRDDRSRFILELSCDDGYMLCAVGYYNTDEALYGAPYYGNFIVGSSPTDTAPGRLVCSRGFVDGQVYRTFYARVNPNRTVVTTDPVYFVTGGYLVISANAVSGLLSTHFGSVITVAYSGPVQLPSEAAPPLAAALPVAGR